jgi:hypothetical protein
VPKTQTVFDAPASSGLADDVGCGKEIILRMGVDI